MCGIVAYLGSDNFSKYVMQGLKLLQNRGYDSVGISSLINGSINTIKYASTYYTNDSIIRLEESIYQNEIQSCIGIGHTRWATHGGKTNENAHPHHDSKDRISLVHNGIIENFKELKTKLIQEGYTFRSHTDTEIIAIMIGKYLDLHYKMEDAIRETVSMLLGTWALVIIHKDFPQKMWITRNGSPLLLGMEDEHIMVASEQIAFGNHIKKYIVLNNHDLIEISKEGNTMKFNTDIHRYTMKDKLVFNVETNPQNFQHWMLKEIYEQPESILRAINNGGRIENDFCVKLGGLDTCCSQLTKLNHLILLGCGTSYHAGMWALNIFKTLDIFDSITLYDGAEFNCKDIPKKGYCGVILLSQSGETKDLHRCIQIAKENDLITIGVVNSVDSLIARETDCGVYLNAGREVAVASTKSYTNQCIVLTLIALWFSQQFKTHSERRRKIINDIRNIPYQIQCIFDEIENIKHFASEMNNLNKSSMFILGKGSNEAIAKEGALKIKEVSYIHAEGYSSSSLKHGPFALIEENLPIILIDIDDIYRDKTRNVYEEIKSRCAHVLVISDNYDESYCNNVLKIEKNNTFGGIIANVYLQLIAYYLSLKKGYNPDFPRNLAKVVTVE
jgi:glucosamine--fructose-6-phosphate aminotransferase (isomerizing)